MAPAHGEPRVGIHQDHVEEEHLSGLHDLGVALVEHRKVDPDRVVDSAHAIAAGLKAGVLEAVGVEDFGVGCKHVSHGGAGANGGLAGFECFDRGAVHLLLAVAGGTHDDRAHHSGVVAGVGAGPFEGELVLRVQMPAA